VNDYKKKERKKPIRKKNQRENKTKQKEERILTYPTQRDVGKQASNKVSGSCFEERIDGKPLNTPTAENVVCLCSLYY
jgi:hypothetical protein